jgi:UDP-N-acetylglucosamine acyltransferase
VIHPTAIIEPGAQLGNNVKVGPYSYIGNDVEIGDDCIIESHVVIKGPSVIGNGNHIFQFASVGEACQDKKYKDEPTKLIIGDNNVIRECATIHRGTIQDEGITKIGSNNLFMAYTHVAHDCVIGNNCIFANNASAAGHVHVGDWVILAGNSGIHQFCYIGSHAFVGMYSGVN